MSESAGKRKREFIPEFLPLEQQYANFISNIGGRKTAGKNRQSKKPSASASAKKQNGKEVKSPELPNKKNISKNCGENMEKSDSIVQTVKKLKSDKNPINSSGLQPSTDAQGSQVLDKESGKASDEDDDKENEEEGLKERSTKLVSEVWKFFERQEDGKAKCKFCNAIISRKYGSTSALTRHLLLHDESRKETKANIVLKKDIVYLADESKKAKELTTAVAEFIIGGLHPFSVVEEPKFKKLMNTAVENYRVPCRTTFSRNIIPQMYKQRRNEVAKELQDELKGRLNNEL